MATQTAAPTRRDAPDGSARAGRPGRRARPSPQLRRRRRRDNAEGWAFVVPAMLVIMGLSVFPAAWALLLSLQRWNGFAVPRFVGAGNYTRLVSDQEFIDAAVHTVVYVGLFVPASVLAGLFLAVALNRTIRFIGFYRTAIFVPFVASAAATGILSTYLFSPQYGLVNNVLASARPAHPGLAGGSVPGDGGDRDHVAVGPGGLHHRDLPGSAAGHSRRAARGGPHRRCHPVADLLAHDLAATRSR